MTRRNYYFLGSLSILLIVVNILSLSIGAGNCNYGDAYNWIFDSTTQECLIVMNLRLNRTFTAIVVGLSLGVAGYLIQTITRNSLADPGILGINATAAIFVLAGAAFFNATIGIQTLLWAGLGSVLGLGVLMFLNTLFRQGNFAIILIGVAITAALSALTNFMVLTTQQLQAFQNWILGSVTGKTTLEIQITASTTLIGIMIAFFMNRDLDLISIGEEKASSMGLKLARSNILIGVAIALLVAGATAIAGPILFVGLAAPNIARKLSGAKSRLGIALSALIGILFIMFSDIFARIVESPGEVSLGIVISVFGALSLLVTMRRVRT